MKKVFSVLSLLALVFSLFAVPLVGQAQDDATRPCAPDEIECCDTRVGFVVEVAGDRYEVQAGQGIRPTTFPQSPGVWGIVCMLATIHHITNWIFYIIMVVVMVMILAGAFMFLTSSGDTTKTGKATKTITFAVIGMVVALLARAIPAAVRFITGL